MENYREQDDGKAIKREANHLIDFLGNFTLKETRDQHALRPGNAKGGFLPRSDGGRPDSLYSAYTFYCQCYGLTPINRFTFNNALADGFKETGEKIEYSEKIYRGFPTTNVYWKDRQQSITAWEG